jgi:hypothetical protein
MKHLLLALADKMGKVWLLHAIQVSFFFIVHDEDWILGIFSQWRCLLLTLPHKEASIKQYWKVGKGSIQIFSRCKILEWHIALRHIWFNLSKGMWGQIVSSLFAFWSFTCGC